MYHLERREYDLAKMGFKTGAQFLQERLRHLVRSMTRCVTELHNKRGGYTRY
jgi:hypothetical protein